MTEDGLGFDVVGLGAATVDLIHVVEALPGEELVQRAVATEIQGGGPVATAMVTLARLGARAVSYTHLRAHET